MAIDISELLDIRNAVQRIPEWKRRLARLTGWKIPVGLETRPGWSGSLPFYVFWCYDCNTWSKDHAHSQRGKRYINCMYCGKYFGFPKLTALTAKISAGVFGFVCLSLEALIQRRKGGARAMPEADELLEWEVPYSIFGVWMVFGVIA